MNNLNKEKESLLTGADVAKLIGVNINTLAVWRHHGKHLPFIKIGRSVRYKYSDVLAYIDDRTYCETLKNDIQGGENE